MQEEKQQDEPQVGDIVRVTYPGVFYGQEVEVLQRERNEGRTMWYQLDVKGNKQTPRPSWFEIFEFEVIKRNRDDIS